MTLDTFNAYTVTVTPKSVLWELTSRYLDYILNINTYFDTYGK